MYRHLPEKYLTIKLQKNFVRTKSQKTPENTTSRQTSYTTEPTQRYFTLDTTIFLLYLEVEYVEQGHSNNSPKFNMAVSTAAKAEYNIICALYICLTCKSLLNYRDFQFWHGL